MMDWTSIITALIAAIVPTGGLTALVTMRDKKTAAFLENVKGITEQWQKMVDEKQETIEAKRAEVARMEQRLDSVESKYESQLKVKDEKIDSLYKTINHLRNDLDNERTARAVAELMKCEKTSCTDRIPPFGQGQQVQCKLIDRRSNEDKQ